MKVYLDYAATSPVKKEVLGAMMPYLTSDFGNPSSIHEWGRIARGAVDEARQKIAQFLNCEPQEIIFTSDGTESDNLAIMGIIAFENSNTNIQSPISKPISNFHQPISIPHVITSQIEHHAIIKTCEYLEKQNLAEVTYIKPNADGIIEVNDIGKAIKDNTVLISIMYVNNELGTIQPIREIGKIIERENGNRLKESGKQLGKEKLEKSNTDFQSPISKQISDFHQPISKIYFHTDAVQAAEYQNMNVDYLHVDILTISGHKIGAPKGIGALYIKKGTPIVSQMHGGEQEFGLRAGTENVAGIIALAKAIALIQNAKIKNQNDNSKFKNLRNYFIEKVLKEIPETELNGSKENRSPNNANFYFKYVEGESILLNLDLTGIAASSGSACASQSLEPSHVIMAVYNNPERAHGSIRFTLGQNTTQKEIDYTIEKLKEIIARLRKMSPLAKGKI